MLTSKMNVEHGKLLIESLLPFAQKGFDFKNDGQDAFAYAELQINEEIVTILQQYELTKEDLNAYMINDIEEPMLVDLVPLAFDLHLSELCFVDELDGTAVRLIRTDDAREWES